jgi:hypothetical protein
MFSQVWLFDLDKLINFHRTGISIILDRRSFTGWSPSLR